MTIRDALEKYCLDDVKVTREVYEYGVSHGYIWFTNSGVKEKILVKWSAGATVEDILKKALDDGQQLFVRYVDKAGAERQFKIDIQKLKGEKIQAYSPDLNGLFNLELARIKKAEPCGQMGNFQKTLL